MGLVDKLKGKRVCIDTAPIIYFIEKHPKYIDLLHPVFTAIDAGSIDAITSTVTLLEVLVLPLRNDDKALAKKYREVLLYSEGFTTYEMLHEVSELSAELRAKYNIKTPDAIQIATGILYGATFFLTNDPALEKVSEIKVMVLDDFFKAKGKK
ncbi:MAG: PIN domain-containing protein [Deltaproteobacteria bacterium]|nr:PIN domain-containing protein [Deltaproteobacteria bacterium]